jgi:hypothetical protein
MKKLLSVAGRMSLSVIVGIVFVLSSCASPKNVPGALFVKGVVRFVELGSGCWVLEAGDNIREKKFYELTGSDLDDIKINNAEVQLWIVPKPDVASSCEVGTVAEIIDVVDVQKAR